MTFDNSDDSDSNSNDSKNKYSNNFWRTVMDDSDDQDFDIRLTVGDFNVAPKLYQDTAGYLHVNTQIRESF